jgi:hypothetical protein
MHDHRKRYPERLRRRASGDRLCGRAGPGRGAGDPRTGTCAVPDRHGAARTGGADLRPRARGAAGPALPDSPGHVPGRSGVPHRTRRDATGPCWAPIPTWPAARSKRPCGTPRSSSVHCGWPAKTSNWPECFSRRNFPAGEHRRGQPRPRRLRRSRPPRHHPRGRPGDADFSAPGCTTASVCIWPRWNWPKRSP